MIQRKTLDSDRKSVFVSLTSCQWDLHLHLTTRRPMLMFRHIMYLTRLFISLCLLYAGKYKMPFAFYNSLFFFLLQVVHCISIGVVVNLFNRMIELVKSDWWTNESLQTKKKCVLKTQIGLLLKYETIVHKSM